MRRSRHVSSIQGTNATVTPTIIKVSRKRSRLLFFVMELVTEERSQSSGSDIWRATTADTSENNHPVTSSVHSLYDPLGLIAPHRLAGKRICARRKGCPQEWLSSIRNRLVVHWTGIRSVIDTTRLLGYGLFSKNCVLRTVEEEHTVVLSRRPYECLIAEIALEMFCKKIIFAFYLYRDQPCHQTEHRIDVGKIASALIHTPPISYWWRQDGEERRFHVGSGFVTLGAMRLSPRHGFFYGGSA